MLDFLELCNSHFVRDAVMTDFELNVLDGVTEELVSVFDIVLPDKDSVTAAIDVAVLGNIDTVILHIIYI